MTSGESTPVKAMLVMGSPGGTMTDLMHLGWKVTWHFCVLCYMVFWEIPYTLFCWMMLRISRNDTDKRKWFDRLESY